MSMFYATFLGAEHGQPVHVALVRVLLLYSPRRDETCSDGHVLSWCEDSDEVAEPGRVCAMSVEQLMDDVDRVMYKPPPGWSVHCPQTGMFGAHVRWGSGHESSSAVVSDVYPADLTALLTVVTHPSLIRRNKDAGLWPAWPFMDPAIPMRPDAYQRTGQRGPRGRGLLCSGCNRPNEVCSADLAGCPLFGPLLRRDGSISPMPEWRDGCSVDAAGVTFCACGIRLSECDGSGAACKGRSA